MKIEHHIIELHKKYLQDQCSAEELEILFKYFEQPEHEDMLRGLISAEFDRDIDEKNTVAVNNIVNNVDIRLQQMLQDKTVETDHPSVKIKQESIPAKKIRFNWNFSRTAAAAVVFMTLSAGIYFFVKDSTSYRTHQDLKQVAKSISPGGNKAILTLADGTQIVLTDADNGQLATQTGVKITKTKDGQLVYNIQETGSADNESGKVLYNTITTPRGGRYEVNLPDGSRVWLNAATSIKFPTSFKTSKERRIELLGEAYFEVSHDKSKPFRVATVPLAIPNYQKQEIEVLGTHFNINAYTDEPSIKTTLLEGSVRVSNLLRNSTLVLTPGQQSSLGNQGLSVKSVNPEEFIAWKNNKFMFDGNTIQGIMRQISRWYDVDVVFNGNISKEAFAGKISRFKNLYEVLDLVELTGLVHFKVEGRRIIVMP